MVVGVVEVFTLMVMQPAAVVLEAVAMEEVTFLVLSPQVAQQILAVAVAAEPTQRQVEREVREFLFCVTQRPQVSMAYMYLQTQIN
jgi:hypothetical protein